MGIPSYFNFILKNHPNIIIQKKYICCDYLFIDANSLIYDSINELEFQISDNIIVYEKVYEKVIQMMHLLNVNEKVYVCFDGVPPLPKMYQQKQRRFKSIMTKSLLSKNSLWNTNQITPGTKFMTDLDAYLSKKFASIHKITFNGSDNPGEGEHKICHYIRMNGERLESKTKIIYGLDADLIMLGLILSCEFKNIYLYKETQHFDYISNIDKDLHYYFDLNKLGLEIDNIMNNFNISQSIYDYILICFLCGNDFLPHLPSVNIRNNGIESLINLYKSLNKNHKCCLINVENKTIIWNHFRKYINLLSKNEQSKIQENINWKMKYKHRLKPLNYEEKLNYLPCFDLEKENYLLGNMTEYNSYILKNNNIEEICLKYLKTIEWTWYYYNGILINNDIYYDETHGPLFKDILKYIPICDDEHVNVSVKNNPSIINNYSPISQLYFVLPFCDHDKIIPHEIYKKTYVQLYKEFPLLKNDNYDVDYTFCKYFWEGHLVLDHIDIFKLNNIVKTKI